MEADLLIGCEVTMNFVGSDFLFYDFSDELRCHETLQLSGKIKLEPKWPIGTLTVNI